MEENRRLTLEEIEQRHPRLVGALRGHPHIAAGCAFEELISLHGGMGGPQTRPFLLYPSELPAPQEPIVGAASVHAILSGWRRALQGEPDQLI
jgi:hypothetical protein